MFESIDKLALGLVTGIAFGFLLHKGRVARHHVIVGQLLLRDFTVMKIMLTAVAVGAIGVYALVELGVTHLDIKPAGLGGVLVGAGLFGIGLALLGYCPGTTIAAAGEGRRDAFAGIAGMLGGALLFVLAFPWLSAVRPALADYGETTLPELTGSSPWLWLVAVSLAGVALYLADRWRHAHAHGHV
jgi:uncharacterized protein